MNLNQENWDRICSILVDEYGMLKAQKETFIDKLSVYSVEGNLVILSSLMKTARYRSSLLTKSKHLKMRRENLIKQRSFLMPGRRKGAWH